MANSVKNRREALQRRTGEHYKKKDSAYERQGVLDTSSFENNIPFFKLKKGINLIDIIPWKLTSKKFPGNFEEGDEEYVLDVYVHRDIAGVDYVCLKKNYGKPCFLCDEVARLDKQGATDEEITAIKAKRRVFYNIIDLDDEDKGIQIFEASHFQVEKKILEEAETGIEGEYITFAAPDDGNTVKIKGTSSSFKGKDFIEPSKFDLIERDEQYDWDIVEDAYPLDEMLIVRSYEEMVEACKGMISTESGSLADDKEEDKGKEKESSDSNAKKKSLKKKKKKAIVADEDEEKEVEDDSTEDERDEVKEEGKPSETSKKRSIEDRKKQVSKDDEKDKGKCPSGHVFGEECNEHSACDECDIWDACADEYNKHN